MHHWHAVRNVSGYLPDSDEPAEALTWEDARSALDEDMKSLLDSLDYAPEDQAGLDEVYREVTMLRDALAKAAPGAPWLGYSATNGGEYDIPTAWQVMSCDSAECGEPE